MTHLGGGYSSVGRVTEKPGAIKSRTEKDQNNWVSCMNDVWYGRLG